MNLHCFYLLSSLYVPLHLYHREPTNSNLLCCCYGKMYVCCRIDPISHLTSQMFVSLQILQPNTDIGCEQY